MRKKYAGNGGRMKPKKIYYFAATHWDREWYKTVDEFRFRLVKVMDEVIQTLLEHPEFERFTLDGQTCILEDYLTIRPENQAILTRLIQEGRLLIGPWYTMPDEFLLSSESLIQNLLLGHSITAGYEVPPLKTGYVCDTFGHIANLPQILNGFEISSALISRGTNDSELECFFRWNAPDGSSLSVFKAPEICGYGSFFYEVLSGCQSCLPVLTPEEEEAQFQRAVCYVSRELTRTSLPYVILMDGMDHETIHGSVLKLLQRLSKEFNCPVVQTQLDQIFPEIQGKYPERTGELASHGKANVMHNKLIPHTLSSRYDLKSANDICQNLLEHYMLPSAAIDTMYGRDSIPAYLSYAYRLLLQNHAHDSICGCSIDAVHREMLTRFEKSRRTAEEYFRRFCERTCQTAETGTDGCLIRIYNPLPYEYYGFLEFDIEFPTDFPVTSLPYMKYEQRNAFRIYGEDGEEIPYTLVQAARSRLVKQFGGNTHLTDPHRVAITALLRPMGFTVFTIRPSDLPYRNLNRLSNGPVSCENEWIEFCISPDGTITLTDKETGRIYPGLHSFLDCCEMGDGWYHIRPVNDQVISSLGQPVTISKTFDGAAACKFQVVYELQLPKEKQLEHGFVKRSECRVPYRITSEFTITRASKLVRVHTRIENSITDHRLTLHLPTHIESECYEVNQCNLILKRNSGLELSHYDWKEADITEYPMESMAMIRDHAHTHGLLFLSGGGLHEVSCPKDAQNSIDITLLRCFGKTVGTNGEPDGQLQGLQEFDYAFLPLASETNAELVRLKDQFVAGYRAFTVPAAPKEEVPEERSAFILESQHCVYLTALPANSGGIILRLANYSEQEDKGKITFDKKVKRAVLCNFLEKEISPATVNETTVCFQAGGLKLINLRVEFEPE